MSFPPDFPLLEAEHADLVWAGDVLSVTLTAIEQATSRIDVGMFIVGGGIATTAQGRVQEVLDAMIRARYRDVDCRVLVNDFAGDLIQPTLNRVAAHYLRDGAVAVRLYRSDRHRSAHSKYLMVDDDVAIVGSGNWSSGGLTANLEAAVRLVSGPMVRSLRRRFDADWLEAQEIEPLP